MRTALNRNSDLKAIAILMVALAAFQVSDALSKMITEELPLLQLTFIRTLTCSLIILIFLVSRKRSAELKSQRKAMLLIRGLIFTVISYSYIVVLKNYPINMMAAAFCGAPLIITALSPLLLKEKVSPMQWLATLTGFIGVLMVLQPDFSNPEPSMFALLLIPIGYAYLILNGKLLSMTESSWTINFYSFGIAALTLCYFSAYDWTSVSAAIYLQVVISAIFGVAAFGLLIYAFSIGRAATVSPFEYTAVIMALVMDMVFWQLIPNGLTVAGIVLILFCGVLQVLESSRTNSECNAK